MARPGVLSDPGTLAQFKKQRLSIVFLFEGHFLHSSLYLWTGIGEFAWNGITWQGAGTLMGLSSIKETGDLQAVGMTVSLSGIDEAVISAAFNELRQGQPCTVWVALFDFNVQALVTWPYPVFTGRVDVPVIDDSGDTAIVSVQLENRMVDFERERVRFYDPQTQNIYYPGDRGFDYVASLQDQKIFWGISD